MIINRISPITLSIIFLQTASPTADILSTSPSLDGLPSAIPCMDRRVSLAMHGVWSEEFVQMGLPSFKPAYLCLLRIPLDVVHECLRLRLEQRPETDPSYMSVRQVLIPLNWASDKSWFIVGNTST